MTRVAHQQRKGSGEPVPGRIPALARGAVLSLALLAAVPAAAQEPGRRQDDARTPAVERYLRAQMALNHIPAVSVAVVRAGRTELLGAYGTANLEWNAAASPATAYQLASATKPLTGTLLMLLVQDGALSLDAPVRTWLPEAPAEWQPITLRLLATHASGISDDLGDTANGTAEEATRRLMGLPLAFEPGSRSSYGIGGYAVLQHVIERVTGTSFDVLLRERLLAPLGMTRTRFDHSTDHGPFRDADVVPQRAGIYAADGTTQRITWFHYGSAALTAGGLLASAADLAAWAAALDGDALLAAPHRDAMWHAPAGTGEGGFGIGWALGRYRGRPTVGHSGGPALADILHFPGERLTIIVLANQARMYPYLAQGVADILLPAPAEEAPPAIVDAAPELTRRLHALLTAFAAGEFPDEAFTDEARAGFIPQVRTFLPPFTRSLGVPTGVQLVEEERTPERWARAYDVRYGPKPVLWRFELAPDGRVQSFRPWPR